MILVVMESSTRRRFQLQAAISELKQRVMRDGIRCSPRDPVLFLMRKFTSRGEQ